MSTTIAAIVVLALALSLCIKPTGSYIADVLTTETTGTPHPVVHWLLQHGAGIERQIYRCCGINPEDNMSWRDYVRAVLIFSCFGALCVYGLQRCQAWLPLNPQHFGTVPADTAFNTAVSFVSNTNWQMYSGESTLSYFTQMAALTVQNFVSTATGLAVAIALMRGLARHAAPDIGNFWCDLVRATLYVLLPLSVIMALILVSCGVIQNFAAYHQVMPLQSGASVFAQTALTQTLPMGPVASQEAIKELGTNGGGFMNANSAHPFENPNVISNLLEMFALLLLPLALTHTFGKLSGDVRQGRAVLAAMLIMLGAVASLAIHSEQQSNPSWQTSVAGQAIDTSSGNMEGKEVRFGSGVSALFAALTTGTSTGAVISMHDSFTPLGGLAPLLLMQLGEVSPGGVGTGLYGMLIFAIIAVFVAGLMIGRTPEYLGKKIEAFDMKMASLAILVTPLVVLTGTALAVSLPQGQAGIGNPGAHGFSEVLYAFTSAGNNNGSAFAGLNGNMFYNLSLGIAMWLGRFWVIIPVLALAGSLAAKKRLPITEGTLPTHGPLFVMLLIGTVFLVGLLTYVPALALGPIVEQLTLTSL